MSVVEEILENLGLIVNIQTPSYTKPPLLFFQPRNKKQNPRSRERTSDARDPFSPNPVAPELPRIRRHSLTNVSILKDLVCLLLL